MTSSIDVFVAVVIPAYRVKRHILRVIAAVPASVRQIYVVDDCCPEQSGRFVEEQCHEERVRVLYNAYNLGVGGAVVRGYREALLDGATVVVKIDGDGQMDPAQIGCFIMPILEGRSDYTKGNRFFNLEGLEGMPWARLIGNAMLSFFSRLSSGYWRIFDPTNGYTAIHASALRMIPLQKLAERYFFESDMLFRLSTIRAVVEDIPVSAHYGDEQSNLAIRKVILQFLVGNLRNFVKRIFYQYFLRDFNVGSIYLVTGSLFILLGSAFGAWKWTAGLLSGTAATSGTVMLAALPILIGTQLLLAAVHYDIENQPREPISHSIPLHVDDTWTD